MGDEIPETNTGPFNQNDLVKYAKASGDFNPIHLDKEFGKTIGLDNVSVQFCSITKLEERLICKGEVSKIEKNNQKKIITLKLKVLNLSGEVKILGKTIFSI